MRCVLLQLRVTVPTTLCLCDFDLDQVSHLVVCTCHVRSYTLKLAYVLTGSKCGNKVVYLLCCVACPTAPLMLE